MATTSPRPRKFLRSSGGDGVFSLAELNDKLSKRRQLFDSGEFPRSGSDSPTHSPVSGGKFSKPRPPIKNRSESLTDLQKHRVNKKLTKSVSEGTKSLSQSLSLGVNHAVVRDSPSTGSAANCDSPGESFHSKSLPKPYVHSVIGPPPSRPPPKFRSGLGPSVKEADEESEGVPFTPMTPIKKKKKKKGGAHKLLKKLKKKQTRKVSEIPPNHVLIGHVAMDTISPPTESRKGYQNIFDFEAKEYPSGRSSESFSKAPKKPMPLPRTNSMSNSSFRFVSSTPEILQQTDQSDCDATPVDLPLIKTPPTHSDDEGIKGTAQRNDTRPQRVSTKRLAARRPTRRHRSTQRKARQLRNGVCSDSETKTYSSSDDDGYIKMNPPIGPMLLALPTATPTSDPRASGYYLKILPPRAHNRRALSEEPGLYPASSSDSDSTSDPDEDPTPPPHPNVPLRVEQTLSTSPDYIHMESWMTESGDFGESVDRDIPSNWITEPVATGNQESQSLPVHLLSKTLGNSPKKEAPPTKRSSNSLGVKSSLGTDRGRMIKYSDVTIHPVKGLPRKPSDPKKFRYQTVNLDEGTVKEVDQPLPVPEKAPLSQPHTLTPSQPLGEERIYYKTVSSQAGSQGSHVPQPHAVTAPPLTNLLPVRQLDWHSYVEIDTDEFDSSPENEPIGSQSSDGGHSSSQESSPYKVAPPTVPDRPDDLDGWVQSRIHSRQQLVSGDYSYVKRGMIPVWLTSGQHRRLVEMASCQLDQPVPAPCASGQQVLPPNVPPKSASLLREVGLDQFKKKSPEPYLYPVFLKKRAHIPGDPSARVTLSKVARIKKKSNKSERPPPVKPYRPREGKSPTSTSTKSLGDPCTPDRSSTSSMSDKSPVSIKSPPPLPPKKMSLARTSPPPVSATTPTSSEPTAPKVTTPVNHESVTKTLSVLSAAPNKSPPPVVKKTPLLPTSPPAALVSGEGPTSCGLDTVCPIPSEQDPSPELSVSCDLGSHMDRYSLAVLCQHTGEIVRRLSQRKESDSGSDSDSRMEPKQNLKDSSSTEQAQCVRSLDEVVLELDLILRQHVCSRTELIRAIEDQLQISISEGAKERQGAKETTQKADHSYLNMECLPDVQERKPRSGTVIQHDTDSEDDLSHLHTHTTPTPQPHIHTSPLPRLHSKSEHTYSTPSLTSSPRLQSRRHPRTLSTPQIKIDDLCPDNNNQSSRTDVVANSCHGNLSVSRGDTRCHSNGWPGPSPLKRANAKRRTSTSACEEVGVVNSFSDGNGVFTHHGGLLTKMGSGVQVEVPEGAVPMGQKQRLTFDIVQTTFDPQESTDSRTRSLSELSVSLDVDQSGDRRNRQIQLSPMILIGPSGASLSRPIKIKLPHCLPYRNNSWHLQVFARPHDSSEDSWTEVTNTIGLVDLPSRKQKKEFRNSTCQLHLDYVTITTTELGYFKLMGRPIRNGVLSAKQMVGSVFSCGQESESEAVRLEVYITDALTDHVQSLEHTLLTHGRRCLQRNMPVLCFGDGRDMEVLISCQTKPLGTMAIPFGQFWRQKVIGQACASFQINQNLLSKSRTLTLKVQQAGSKYIHETNFLVP